MSYPNRRWQMPRGKRKAISVEISDEIHEELNNLVPQGFRRQLYLHLTEGLINLLRHYGTSAVTAILDGRLVLALTNGPKSAVEALLDFYDDDPPRTQEEFVKVLRETRKLLGVSYVAEADAPVNKPDAS